jgi:hypothetical protein
MFMRTSWGSREIRGLISLKSLFDTVNVFKFVNENIDSGNTLSLLLWRSITERLGAFSRFSIETI